MQVLRARLLEAAERERDAERSAERRSQVGGGGRGEKIRTYNFKENRLTDHRIGFTIYRLADVLAGDLDDTVAALAADERARQLADDATPMSGAVRWRELLAETTAQVGERPAARWLCEVASGADDLDDVLDEPVTQRMVAHLDAMLARYAAGEPLAYVLGRWSFRHLDLIVDHRVLIPRPETEVVAGVAIDLARAEPRPVTVADLGTGSGAIGLAVADELPVDGVRVWLTDISPDALDVARANLAGIGRRAANVRIAGGSWFDALPADVVPDVVVSNPPYVAAGSPDVDAGVRDWEPHAALFAGPDGLDAIRLLVAGAPGRIRPGGWLVLEIGADQGAAVEQLLRDGRVHGGVDPSRPRRPGPRRGRPRPVNWAGSVALSETIPAQRRIPPRWGTQPKRTAISESSDPSSGVTSASAPTRSRAAENSARRRTRLVMRASTESSISVTASSAHALRAVAIAWPRYCS